MYKFCNNVQMERGKTGGEPNRVLRSLHINICSGKISIKCSYKYQLKLSKDLTDTLFSFFYFSS